MLTALTGVTAGAASDGFSHFRSILRRTQPSANLSDELPLMNGEDVSGMEQNISENRIEFTGSDTMSVATAGMYYDNSTMLVTVEMKPHDGISLPDGTIALPYFYLVSGGERTELPNLSGLANAARVTRGDEPDTYYATFYLTSQNLADSKVGLTIRDIITTDNMANIQDRITAEQEGWRDEFDFDSHTLEEWKQYWRKNDFDTRTRDKLEEYLSECGKLVEGEWTAEFDISDTVEAATFSRDGFTVTADTLSLTFDCDNELSERENAIPVVTMKDGTVVYDGGTNEREWFTENGVITADNSSLYANRFANVFSYSEPHPLGSIADISVYVVEYGDNGVTATRHIIYEAEAEK